jgi:cell division inhibitor SepF
MGVRDRLDRIAAWFGFGVDDDDYYEDEEEEDRRYGNEEYVNGARSAEPGPTVRRLGRAERSSAFGTSLGDLFGSESSARQERYSANQNPPAHLRPVPDQRTTRVSVLEPSSFNDAQNLADRFKRQQPVILNLQNVDGDLSRRMVDFCSGLTYALDGNIQSVANRVFLLTPRDVEVSAEERKRIAERAFFNQL